eukprot:gene863-757_t
MLLNSKVTKKKSSKALDQVRETEVEKSTERYRNSSPRNVTATTKHVRRVSEISDLHSQALPQTPGLADFSCEGRSRTYLVQPYVKPQKPFRIIKTLGTESCFQFGVSITFVEMIYFWNECPQVQSAQEDLSLQLRKSLSRALSVFPVVAGRLVDDGNMAECNGFGIPFRVQRISGKAAYIGDQPDRFLYCDTIVGQKVLNGEHPLCTVVVSFFDEGGMSLGVVFSHSICDGKSYQMFMESWSKIHAGEKIGFTPIFEYPLNRVVVCNDVSELDAMASQFGFKRRFSFYVSKLVSIFL